MMSRLSIAMTLGLLAIVAQRGVAQTNEDPAARGGEASRGERAEEHFFPPERVIRWFLTETSRRVGREYEFDEYQQQLAQEAITDNMLKFIKEHETELKPLVNEFFDATYGDTPPDADFVASWAERALPMLDKFRGALNETADSMRDFMTEEQEMRLDGSLAALDAGTEIITQRLHGWADGGFDWEHDWSGSRKAQLIEIERNRELKARMDEARSVRLNPSGAAAGAAANNRGKTGAGSAPPEKKDEWDAYVESFITRYELDDRQTQQARLLLESQKEHRDQYLRQKGAEMEAIEKKFAKAENEEQVRAAEAEYQKLLRPISTIFDVLKKKLDKLPTRQQRAKAAEKAPQAQASEGAPAKPAGE